MTETELLQIHKNNLELAKLQWDYEKLLGASAVRSQNNDGMPYVGRAFDTSMCSIEDKCDIENKYKALHHQNQLLIRKARNYIEQLPDMTLRMILTLVYINGMLVCEAAAAIGITEQICRQILKVHLNNVF